MSNKELIERITRLYRRRIKKTEAPAWKTVIKHNKDGSVVFSDGTVGRLLSPIPLKVGDRVLVYNGNVLNNVWRNGKSLQIPVTIVISTRFIVIAHQGLTTIDYNRKYYSVSDTSIVEIDKPAGLIDDGLYCVNLLEGFTPSENPWSYEYLNSGDGSGDLNALMIPETSCGIDAKQFIGNNVKRYILNQAFEYEVFNGLTVTNYFDQQFSFCFPNFSLSSMPYRLDEIPFAIRYTSEGVYSTHPYFMSSNGVLTMFEEKGETFSDRIRSVSRLYHTPFTDKTQHDFIQLYNADYALAKDGIVIQNKFGTDMSVRIIETPYTQDGIFVITEPPRNALWDLSGGTRTLGLSLNRSNSIYNFWLRDGWISPASGIDLHGDPNTILDDIKLPFSIAADGKLSYVSMNKKSTLAAPGNFAAELADGGSLLTGENYYYRITAWNNLGESSRSEEAVALPTTVPDKKSIRLTWTAVEGADGYIIYRSRGAAAQVYKTLRHVIENAGTVEWTDTGAALSPVKPEDAYNNHFKTNLFIDDVAITNNDYAVYKTLYDTYLTNINSYPAPSAFAHADIRIRPIGYKPLHSHIDSGFKFLLYQKHEFVSAAFEEKPYKAYNSMMGIYQKVGVLTITSNVSYWSYINGIHGALGYSFVEYERQILYMDEEDLEPSHPNVINNNAMQYGGKWIDVDLSDNNNQVTRIFTSVMGEKLLLSFDIYPISFRHDLVRETKIGFNGGGLVANYDNAYGVPFPPLVDSSYPTVKDRKWILFDVSGKYTEISSPVDPDGVKMNRINGLSLISV